MRKSLFVILIVLCMPMAFAGYYYDDYTDGIFNWTDTNSAGWSENASDGYISSSNIFVRGEIVKDFGREYNLSDNLQINITTFQDTSDPSFNTFVAITNGDDWATMTNFILFSLSEDKNTDGYDDVQIDCGGSCSCAQDLEYGSVNDFYYETIIGYDDTTGNLSLWRNDSIMASTILSGCTIDNWNITISNMREPLARIYSFELSAGDYGEVCTPNWTCDGYGICLPNSTQVCNSVIDLNACGEVYGGDYSEFPAQNCSYITGYVAQYSQSDLDNIVSDGLGTGGAIIVAFIPIIIIGGVVIYGYKLMKRSRK